MGSSVDSSISLDSATGGPLLLFDFAGSGGYSRRDTEELCLPVDYVSDDLRPFLVNAAPEHLPASAPQGSEATGTGPSGIPGPLPGSCRLDKLYELDFQRLERGLEVLKAQQLAAPELPKVLEGNVTAQIHVPSSVTQGYVPALDVLDVNAEGVVVCGSVLVERKAGVRK